MDYIYNLSNSTSGLILSTDFQDYIQFSMLFLVLISVFMIFNSVIFPFYLRELRDKNRIAPSKGNLIFISTLWVGFCLCLLFLNISITIFKPYIATFSSMTTLFLWPMLGIAILFTTIEVLNVAWRLFPL
jgi:hypothetical protein